VRPSRTPLLSAGVAAAVLAESVRRARTRQVDPAEERAFRLFNDAPDRLHLPVWPVMQAGSLAAVGVVTAALFRQGRPRTARAAAVSGTVVWGGVKALKPAIGRGRPERHLDRVAVRGQSQSGLGFPSGHAAVSLTLALVSTRAAGPAARAAALAVAAVAGGARMYVGAHLPLDVVGGYAIGLLCGQLTNTVLERGPESDRPGEER
jgi:membrane-associated phospholipid phosphatase